MKSVKIDESRNSYYQSRDNFYVSSLNIFHDSNKTPKNKFWIQFILLTIKKYDIKLNDD